MFLISNLLNIHSLRPSRSITSLTSLTNDKIKKLLQLKVKKKREALGLVLVEGYRHINDA